MRCLDRLSFFLRVDFGSKFISWDGSRVAFASSCVANRASLHLQMKGTSRSLSQNCCCAKGQTLGRIQSSSDIAMSIHTPVLPRETIALLNLQPGSVVVDGTLGGGGHSRQILELITETGTLIGIDRDPQAVARADAWAPGNMTTVTGNYADIPEILTELGLSTVDAILLDLGLSSDQLADRERGFSFSSDGPLDLRFDQSAGEPASRLVNRLGEKHLADLIFEFGEEKASRRIARKIVQRRHNEPIETANQLAKIVRSCVPRQKQRSIDPATRTFQALRIAINEELKWLSVAVRRLPEVLAVGGRIAIISFHSLEDRMVKQAFVADDRLKTITRKPVTASDEELDQNPRSRSAKLRVAERV